MNALIKLRKKLPCKSAPLAKKPSLAKLLRQHFKLLYVIGVALHQRGVIVNERGNKAVIASVFALAVLFVDKKTFHPTVPHTAGVAGEVHSRSEGLLHLSRVAVALRESRELPLGEMGGLLQPDDLVRLPLEL